MIFITDKTRDSFKYKSNSIIRKDSFSIIDGYFLSYSDLATGNSFPILIQNHSKVSGMMVYEESDAYDSIEVFDETDGGNW